MDWNKAVFATGQKQECEVCSKAKVLLLERSSQLQGNALVFIRQTLGTPKFSPAPRKDRGTRSPNQGDNEIPSALPG